MKVNRPKSTKRRRFPFTEEEMADAFERLLKAGRTLHGVGRFSRVFREVVCHHGRPDFVALARNDAIPGREEHYREVCLLARAVIPSRTGTAFRRLCVRA